jgi:hypothetical protein
LALSWPECLVEDPGTPHSMRGAAVTQVVWHPWLSPLRKSSCATEACTRHKPVTTPQRAQPHPLPPTPGAQAPRGLDLAATQWPPGCLGFVVNLLRPAVAGHRRTVMYAQVGLQRRRPAAMLLCWLWGHLHVAAE